MTGTVVVTAVGGAQQAAAAKAFAAEGWNVRGTVRAAAKAVGSEVSAADLETGAGLDAAFDGVDVIAFTLPQDHRPGTMTRMTAEVVDAAGRAEVTRLILNLAGTIDDGCALGRGAAGGAGRSAERRRAVRADSADRVHGQSEGALVASGDRRRRRFSLSGAGGRPDLMAVASVLGSVHRRGRECPASRRP